MQKVGEAQLIDLLILVDLYRNSLLLIFVLVVERYLLEQMDILCKQAICLPNDFCFFHSIPFSVDDLSTSLQLKDFSDMKSADELLEIPAFQFLNE